MRTRVAKQSTLSHIERQADADRAFAVTLYDASELDRDGESIDLSTVTAREPLTLQIDHDRSVLRTVGTVRAIRAVGSRLRGVLTFAPAGVSEVADQVHRQVAAGITTTVSIGFIAPARPEPVGGVPTWRDVEVIELSLVSVPASPGARVDRAALAKWLGRDDEPVFFVDDDPADLIDVGMLADVLRDPAFRASLTAAMSAPRRREARSDLMGFEAGRRHEPTFSIDPVELRQAVATVVHDALRDAIGAEVRRSILRARGRCDDLSVYHD